MKNLYRGVCATKFVDSQGRTQHKAQVSVNGKQYAYYGYVERDLAVERDSVLWHVVGERRREKFFDDPGPYGPPCGAWATDLLSKLGGPQSLSYSKPEPSATAPEPKSAAAAAFSTLMSIEAEVRHQLNLLRSFFPELAACFPARQPPSAGRGEAAGPSAIPTPPFSSDTLKIERSAKSATCPSVGVVRKSTLGQVTLGSEVSRSSD